MSDRPTPETDAELYPMNGVDIVWPDFARKLERKRDEAKDAIRALAEHGESEIQRITKERDEAITRRMETIMQCELYKQERDEAREDLKFRRGLYKVQEEYLEAARKELTEAKNKLDEEIKWHHRTHKELVETQCKLLDIEYDKLKS